MARMRLYTVHAPPGDADAPERFAFVKDGFSWPALLIPVLWIIWHRMWLTLVCAVIFVLVVLWIELLAGTDMAFWIALLGTVLFAFEANNIRRLSLERRGWIDIGVTSGTSLEEAELRFFEKWLGSGTGAATETREAIARTAFQPTRARDADEPILGLFPEPER